ncbi:glycoside hydrolase family 43 protein [Cohnella thailandensis]|uniref:Family 43 glycosylhydrolase n=1 Tax=Cohnella thailandensis TaxID=557557 RepID=A0A841SRG2_9BACL|nr:glycoside hydrolase family 43 protein [Cohnella thailandensis]MBB6634983.1 family 43 glycosylhydrolase [Cohnella thailandensis]MBP1975794.1 beta-xylosidase [Cohnella thailandensis]
MRLDQIQMRDPFVLKEPSEGRYYLYGSTDPDIWQAKGIGFDVYRSRDLEEWEGPFPAFRPAPDFWADRNFWAPEVHAYKGRYYMFATFKADGVRRGTQILAADHPLGPFRPLSDGPVTPSDWECLDGTLHVDGDGTPWMIFCHEWVQIKNGAVCAIRLSPELDRAVSEPVTLFSASDAEWVEPVSSPKNGTGYVTDGPYAYRCTNGELLLLWSSFKQGRYAQAVARSASGGVLGPWTHEPTPLFESDGGHGMIFRSFDGKILLALHTPNRTPDERPVFIELAEEDGRLSVCDS